jgi:hypothetical protein
VNPGTVCCECVSIQRAGAESITVLQRRERIAQFTLHRGCRVLMHMLVGACRFSCGPLERADRPLDRRVVPMMPHPATARSRSAAAKDRKREGMSAPYSAGMDTSLPTCILAGEVSCPGWRRWRLRLVRDTGTKKSIPDDLIDRIRSGTMIPLDRSTRHWDDKCRTDVQDVERDVERFVLFKGRSSCMHASGAAEARRLAIAQPPVACLLA